MPDTQDTPSAAATQQHTGHRASLTHQHLPTLSLGCLFVCPQVKIADFGLAKQSADAMSTVCGTPQYVAPEVIQGTAHTVYGPEVGKQLVVCCRPVFISFQSAEQSGGCSGWCALNRMLLSLGSLHAMSLPCQLSCHTHGLRLSHPRPVL